MPDELTGQVIGQYRIMEPIGRSGAGHLYRAVQTGTGRAIALKVLPREFLNDMAFAAEFQEQAAPLTRLQHPNIVSLLEAAIADGTPYLAFSYVEGKSLSDRLREMPGGLAPAEAAHILVEAAAGLDHAHQAGVLHRNVKPANIMLDRAGMAALANFGLPVVNDARSHHAGKRYIGTPAYMAPELTTGGGVGRPSDLYALAATFFHILATRPPFDSGNQVAVLLAHVQQPVPAIREYRPDLPIALQAVIERALAKDPADRFPTAREFASSVDTVIRGMGPAADKAPPAAGDPLSTGRVEMTAMGKASSTTIQIKPSRVNLPPLSPDELSQQSAGRSRSRPPAAAPEPAPPASDDAEQAVPTIGLERDKQGAKPAAPTVELDKDELAAETSQADSEVDKETMAAETSKPTVVGGTSRHDLEGATGRETVPAQISRASVQAARQEAASVTRPPAVPKKRSGLVWIGIGLAVVGICLIAAVALVFLIQSGLIGG